METPIKVSIKVHRIIGTLSRMSILNKPTLKYNILYSPIILREFNYFVIQGFKISRFVLESQVLPVVFDT